MKYTLLLLPLLLLTGCSGARLEPSEASGVESRILSNRYLRAEVVPDACGAVVSLQYRPTGTVLTEPFEYSVSKIDLLPDQVSANAAGSRTWLWKPSFRRNQDLLPDKPCSPHGRRLRLLPDSRRR